MFWEAFFGVVDQIEGKFSADHELMHQNQWKNIEKQNIQLIHFEHNLHVEHKFEFSFNKFEC